MHAILALLAVLVIFAVVYHFASKGVTAEVTKIETDVESDVAKAEADVKKL